MIEFAELCGKDQLDELALSICAQAQIDFDPLFGATTTYVEGDGRGQLEFIKVIAGILYRVGAVGVKLRNGENYLYAHLDQPILPPSLMSMELRIRIHPMLHGSFRLQV